MAVRIDDVDLARCVALRDGAGLARGRQGRGAVQPIELRRGNRITPAGAVAGSSFVVTVEQRLGVLAQPNPAS